MGACLVPGEGRWDRRARRKEIEARETVKVCECCFGEIVLIITNDVTENFKLHTRTRACAQKGKWIRSCR